LALATGAAAAKVRLAAARLRRRFRIEFLSTEHRQVAVYALTPSAARAALSSANP
jgi:hypothetical protein